MRIVVTGAASGIGRSVVHGLIAANAQSQILLVDQDAAGLGELAAQYGAGVATMACDVGKAKAGQTIIDEAMLRWGGIDAIVSNAGVLLPGSLATMSDENFDLVFAVNTRATWALAKAAYPSMRDNGGGSIVATASMSAWHPAPQLGAYSASKAALVVLMRQLANEWGPDGIRCNTVSPGPTLTGMNTHIFAERERRAARAASIPTRRMGEPEDVANAVLYLLSPGARQITGVDLLVDGGLSTTLMSSGLHVAE